MNLSSMLLKIIGIITEVIFPKKALVVVVIKPGSPKAKAMTREAHDARRAVLAGRVVFVVSRWDE
jgi:hypothetical protein